MRFTKNNIIQFIKFNAVGILNTGLDMFVFWLLAVLLRMNEYVANVISYTCGVIFSYTVNSHWTFKQESKHTTKETLLFLLVNLVSLGVSQLVLYVTEEWFGIHSELIRKFIAAPTSAVVNFWGNKIFVFRQAE
ncbi:MAG: GtrA-like protein [Firmicutes bacterium ADurb.Bin182]|nr:MAG: GtrA-like protein [Firmicutes bacterium ADurb.Bin182]